jgi:uncharacterized membrane protein YhaH (DUF805 family)
MDIIFSGKGMFFLDVILALCLVVAIQGQQKILFSAVGRIKRQTFLEGLLAWFLLNVLFIIIGIAHFTLSYDDQLAVNFGDVDHVWYHHFVMAYTTIFFLGSGWVLAMLCAKRWHDLNFSGWLALINTVPLLALGYAWSVFLNSVGNLMNKQFAAKSTMLDLWQQMAASVPATLDSWGFWSLVLSGGLIVALGAYLGFAKGDLGANTYGKSAA